MKERVRTALVVGDSLDDATFQALTGACARLRAGVRVWDGRQTHELGGRPALVVAGLAAGARRISDEILELADRRFPGTQVLLVCNEPLVRPMLSLQQGRITLIEPPATVERMASRIRLLLTHEAEAVAARDGIVSFSAPEPRACVGQEFRRGSWWAAGLTCAGPEGDTPAPHPWLGLEFGLTAVLTSPDRKVDEGAVARAIDLLHQGTDGEDLREQLARLLGESAGLVHLTDDGLSWLIYWPCSWQPLWLFSTQRLPRWSNLRHSELTLWRLPAVAGDVIAGLSSAESFAEGDSALPSTKVSAAMLDGGPALFALFESVLAASPRSFSCIVAEVR